MQVRFGTAVSSHFSISNGVKQGGVLSLILFIIYINNLIIQLTLSDPEYFRQLTIQWEGVLKAPPPPTSPHDLEIYCVNLHHIMHVPFIRGSRHVPIF